MRSMSSRSPSTETPRMACPRSAGDGDRMPTGRILVTAPLSIARSSTSASAARPSTRIGVASLGLGVLQGARVAEIAIGDARPAEERDLQQPVEDDRDLAEEEGAVEIRRQQHVVERQQRHRQNGRGAHDVVEIGQRGEAPLRLVEAGERIDEAGIEHEHRQHHRQQPPALAKPGLLETDEKARDHRRRRGEEVMCQNEPHPRREGREPDHVPIIAARTRRRKPSITGFGLPRYLSAAAQRIGFASTKRLIPGRMVRRPWSRRRAY